MFVKYSQKNEDNNISIYYLHRYLYLGKERFIEYQHRFARLANHYPVNEYKYH